MGTIYEQEPQDIIEIRKLIKENECLKRYLSHHLRGELQIIENGIYAQDFSMIQIAKEHILEDIERVGL